MINALPTAKRGRPLLLGVNMDKKVQLYLKKLREGGGAVSARVVVAAARGIIVTCDKTMLEEYGGPVVLEKPWAHSLLARMGFVKGKATTALSKYNDADFEKANKEFLSEVTSVVGLEEIQPEMILNWDQSGIKMVPSSNWTLEKRGSKRVELLGVNDE